MAIGASGTDVEQSSYPGGQAGLSDVPSALHGVLLELFFFSPIAYLGGGMVDGIDIFQPGFENGWISNVALQALDADAFKVSGIAAGTNQGTHPLTRQDELLSEVGTQETSGPRYKLPIRHERIL